MRRPNPHFHIHPLIPLYLSASCSHTTELLPVNNRSACQTRPFRQPLPLERQGARINLLERKLQINRQSRYNES